MKHLSMLRSSDLMRKHIRDFEAALRNPELTKQLFTEYLSNVDRASLPNAASDEGNLNKASGNALVLTPPIRSAASIKELVLDRSTQKFTISLTLPEQERLHKTYRASIFNLLGNIIWQSTRLIVTRDGKLTLTLPAALFESGDYMLAIDGEGSNGETYVLERYYFKVNRN